MNISCNNSLSDNGKGLHGVDLPSHYALRVALQTMKERCIVLQERLTAVEEENSILRNQMPIKTITNLMPLSITQDNLRKQVDELQQQKLQLSEHIEMIAKENRQLWSRLSQIVKNFNNSDEQRQQLQQELHQQHQQEENQENKLNNHHITSKGHQNLIRSRTFTQNSPNPLLRQKHLAAIAAAEGNNVINDKSSLDDLSLEEISLKDVNHDDDDNDEVYKINDDEQYENNKNNFDKMLMNSTKLTSANSLKFGYLNDDSSDDVIIDRNNAGANDDDIVINDDNDLGNELKSCIDTMIDIKNEVLQQQSELTDAINALKEKKAFVQEECIDCKIRNANKPEMIDKIIETKDDLLEDNLKSLIINSNNIMNKSNINNGKELGIEIGANTSSNVDNNTNATSKHLNILEMKRNADRIDKICPMCGKIFNDTISFDDFEEHVETHFIDDDLDPSTYERNFELVSHTVGDF